ncbi:beta-lactamase [Planococcus sp. PAMC 21323]|uniref:serine hydrolase n=1 Tax=Planococcus sp. PAMC 21323 TaxID=1526927 RepID=UPI0005862935|nr:serine hydrolase [Planococcus sp. PAMC 21323]AIY04290.1 beta-lactamase [Planococcus sp. PAMC 21323]
MFKKVILYTNQLEDMKGFYEYQLGFRIVEEDDTSFTLSMGESQLVFRESDRAAVYHFALNIPGNQFTLAKSWTSERVTLNRQEGMDEVFYANFDADAFYFQDPAGNVVEFIARRSVDRMANFTVDSILNISEVSITTTYVEEVGELIEDMDIPVRGSKGIEAKSLNFLGSGHAFILLVEPKRIWYFSKQKSETHPLSIELTDGRQINITEEGRFQQEKSANPILDKMEEIDFSGVAYLAKQEPWAMAKGFADQANERPNTVDTRFGIASGSKLFTALVICQLVEEEKVSFEDLLSELLPKTFPHFNVTIHQLLTHTSGIPDYFDEQTMDDFEDLWRHRPMYRMETASDFIPLFKDQPMTFEPGEKFHYNNAGYIALGLIIEDITGKEFVDAVEERIFVPAQMQNSGYFRLDFLPGQTAFGYIEEEGQWRTNQYAIPVRGGADGGAYVTAKDMANFWNCLMDGTLITGDMLKKMLHVHASGEKSDYGYGLWIQTLTSGALKYHIIGYDPGVSFYSAFYPEKGNILTVLSNKSGRAYELATAIEELKIEEE